MMDTFAEQLVKKTPSSSDQMKKLALLIGGSLIVAALIILSFVTVFAFIFAAIAGYVFFLLITGLDVEYEYTVTNGTLDIDKIIAKRKRVNLISAEVKNFTSFDCYLSVDETFGGTEVIAMGGEGEPFYADFNSEAYGETRIVFSPNERILECIKPYLQRNLKKSYLD